MSPSYSVRETMQTRRRPIPCLDCGGPGSQVEWSSAKYQLLECEHCGLVYAANWEEQLGGSGFHKGNISYWEARRCVDEGSAQSLNEERTIQVLKKLESMAPERTLLDVGCGTGALVGAASKLGWLATGVDLAPAAVEIAQRKGRDCRVVDLFSEELDQHRFGVIVMSEFIEHVPGPSRFFRRARELLLTSGLLYVTTPNVDSLGRRILGSRWAAIGEGHVALFTRERLAALGRGAGLDVVEITTRTPSVVAIAHLLKKASVSPEGDESDSQHQRVQDFRSHIHRSSFLTLVKRGADSIVAKTKLGDTLVALFRKPREG